MTTLDTIRDAIPDYARDLRLNLGSVLTTSGAPGLSEKQIWAVALASAIASRNGELTRDIEALAATHLDATYVNGARAAAAVMGMNNVYYRFLHLVEDPEYAQLPARLRMNVIGNPGIVTRFGNIVGLLVGVDSALEQCLQSILASNFEINLGERRLLCQAFILQISCTELRVVLRLANRVAYLAPEVRLP